MLVLRALLLYSLIYVVCSIGIEHDFIKVVPPTFVETNAINSIVYRYHIRNWRDYDSDSNIPEKAKRIYKKSQKVRDKGNKEDNKKLLKMLKAVHELAPNWAFPTYELANGFLLAMDWDRALKYYRKLDEIAPKGFYQSKIALFTLEKEDTGEFEQGTWLMLSQEPQFEGIQDFEIHQASITQTELRHAFRKIRAEMPNLCPIYVRLVLIDTEGSLKVKQEIIEKGLKCPDIDIETKETLTIYKGVLILQEAVRNPNLTRSEWLQALKSVYFIWYSIANDSENATTVGQQFARKMISEYIEQNVKEEEEFKSFSVKNEL